MYNFEGVMLVCQLECRSHQIKYRKLEGEIFIYEFGYTMTFNKKFLSFFIFYLLFFIAA